MAAKLYKYSILEQLENSVGVGRASAYMYQHKYKNSTCIAPLWGHKKKPVEWDRYAIDGMTYYIITLERVYINCPTIGPYQTNKNECIEEFLVFVIVDFQFQFHLLRNYLRNCMCNAWTVPRLLVMYSDLKYENIL